MANLSRYHNGLRELSAEFISQRKADIIARHAELRNEFPQSTDSRLSKQIADEMGVSRTLVAHTLMNEGLYVRVLKIERI